jgi:hypothetical protein
MPFTGCIITNRFLLTAAGLSGKTTLIAYTDGWRPQCGDVVRYPSGSIVI